MDIFICGKKVNTTSVQSTFSMWNMLNQTKILQMWPIGIEFGSNLSEK